MGGMITDVGIDLDGVVYPFANAFRQYCCERMGRLFLPEPTHWEFYEDWDLDKDTFHQWLDDAAHTHQVFATEQPYEGVTEAWKEFIKMGIKIHVITSRPQSSWEQTAEWLTRNGLTCDSLHFNNTKGFLSKIALGKAAIVDDHIAYYEEAQSNNIVALLMDRPWNQQKTNGLRVSNLLEFTSFIRGYNMSVKTETAKVRNIFNEEKYRPYHPPKTSGTQFKKYWTY